MLKNYRLQSGMSETKASEALYTCRSTLIKMEKENQADANMVISMSKVYDSPEMPIEYCKKVCEIGKMYHCNHRTGSLESIVLNLSKEFNNVAAIKEKLIDIAADGIIDDEEKVDMEKIFEVLDNVHECIEGLKVLAIREGWIKVK